MTGGRSVLSPPAFVASQVPVSIPTPEQASVTPPYAASPRATPARRSPAPEPARSPRTGIKREHQAKGATGPVFLDGMIPDGAFL